MPSLKESDYFSRYIFPTLLFIALGIFITFWQGRASSVDVGKLEATVQANTESISRLSNEVSRLVGYMQGKEYEHKAKP